MLTGKNADKNVENKRLFNTKMLRLFVAEKFDLFGYIDLIEDKCSFVETKDDLKNNNIRTIGYNEFIHNLCKNIPDELYRYDIVKLLDKKALISLFENGEYQTSCKYKSYNDNGNLHWNEVKIILLDEEYSGPENAEIAVVIKNVQEEMHNLEQIGLHIKKEKIYKSAINADANGYFEVNLTKDIILGKIYDYSKSKVNPEIIEPNLGYPISYSKFMRWSLDNVFKSNIKSFIMNTDREFLISKFHMGSRTHETSFWTYNTRGQMFFHKQSYYMSMDEKTGDIIALCVLKDENETSQKEAELKRNNEIISVLSDEYTTIFYVDIVNDVVIPYRITPEFKNFMRLNHLNNKGFEEIMRYYVNNVVMEEDRANVRKSITVENIRKQLYNKKNFNIIYRSMSIGISRFFEMKFAKIGYGTSFDSFVIGFSNKDIQFRREKERQGRMNQNNEIINVLASEYEFVFYVDLDKDSFTPYNLVGENGKIIASYMKTAKTYSEMNKMYIDNWVIKEEQKRVLEESNIAKIKRELSDKKSFKIEFRAFNKHYDIHYYEMRAIKVDDKNSSFSAVVGLADKNDEIRRQAEYNEQLKDARNKAEEASKAKSAFLFNMSHDIRTPMNAILGFTSMAKKYISDTDKVSECLEKVEISGNHLLSLINDVLDMARIENNKIIIDETANNLRNDMEQVIEILRSNAAEKQIDVSLDFVNLVDEDIYADNLRLNRIIMNIMSNSIKYTKPGGSISVLVEQKQSDREGYGKYDLVFKDTGIGMSAKFLETIFDSFTREKTSTISGVQGTGLGMAITKNFVELMGGTIDIESELGVGTTVTCHMYFRLQVNEVAVNEDIQSEDDIDYSEVRILLVEDNELNREIAKDILEDIGITVEEAADGSIAVDMVSAKPANYYDLVFMDIQMPYMDGYKATHAIRNIKDPEVASVPIVAMTANAFEEDKRKAYESGMNGHLAKPININDLFKSLAKFCKKK